MIKYSIIVPTCNNELVARCLLHISKLNSPLSDYEVIVIQNKEDGNIENTVKSYIDKIPNLRFLKEENPGLLYCRHRGAKEANGEILCYLDDDSFVDKNWLVEIEKTFKKNPQALIVGGNNIPCYEAKPPKWLKYWWVENSFCKCLTSLSLIEFKNKNMKVPAWNVYGCNFIIKKDALYEFGGFNPDGVPKDLLKYRGDGETALSLKLNRAGHAAYINPKIKVYHYVPESRMTLEYFNKRAYAQGISDSFTDIRKNNGIEYAEYLPAKECDSERKLNCFKRLYNKVKKRLSKHTKEYKTFINIYKEYEKSYKEGYDFHQQSIKNDSEVLNYVLKSTYLE